MDPRFRGIFFDEDGKPYVEVLFYQCNSSKNPTWWIGKIYLQDVEPAPQQTVERYKAATTIDSFL
jgi:hypothetical protein